ncbi:hypothetical protein [Verrucosispora sp. WMMD1129]|uniref:hypothetical protein n=1 Tax=Verrucosispora sp. WMMD1129 TaxID=3016093 RepID=UPI00249C58F3|nr:hypothetical protein [Verrucosispora sp. WMMD1129]WFE44427.1 hypothetical protein O7624_08820 [Verrucosispora sp. WMMD1129]
MGRTTWQDESSELSRRGLLRAGALLALGGAAAPLTGCGLLDRDEPPPQPDPLTPLLDESRRLAAGLRAAATTHPDLAARLLPLAESHEAHAAELAGLTGVATTSATPTAAPSATPPTDRSAALAELRKSERAGREAAIRACAAAPAERAALLGSIAAARATHLEALR